MQKRSEERFQFEIIIFIERIYYILIVNEVQGYSTVLQYICIMCRGKRVIDSKMIRKLLFESVQKGLKKYMCIERY